MFCILNTDNYFSIPRFEMKGLNQNHITDESLQRKTVKQYFVIQEYISNS